VLKKANPNFRAVPDVPADEPEGTMDRFADGLKRVVSFGRTTGTATKKRTRSTKQRNRSPSRTERERR
jgi:hypothetical protein